MATEVIQDASTAIAVIKHVGEWMQEQDIPSDGWWAPENMNAQFLGQYAKPTEFYAVIVDGKPAAAAIIQTEQSAQDWSSVDGDTKPRAMYVHWVAVERDFAGQGMPKVLIDKACDLAKEANCPLIRLDTDADTPKLCQLYESLGFKQVNEVEEGDHRTVLYEKTVGT